ncbi:hypothetical protein P4O66_016290 [Electrophorus voltai]|uniref:non-specific serine/threonine protein kinase n=1 Tax=Electrophorus voltai TaxID=2609070 RepID=A0AAD9DPC8_9TELE|nr:hypothetical protein P4O66_016290 [Electrophorus voltai]
MDSDERDADSDEEWKRLAEVTDWANHTSASMDPPIHQKLKNKLLRCKDQAILNYSVLGGTLEEPSVILHPVTVLTNMILTSGATDSRRVVEVVGLPHILFNLLEEMLSSPELMKPLVATVLSQLVDHGARVCVRTHTLTALLESLLSGPEEVYHPFPAGWGICDGVLALVLKLLSESERSALPGFLNSKLWCHLWTKVGNMLQNTVSKTNFLSVNGLRDLLSLALLAFCDEPYDCVTLFFTDSNNLGCTLSRLLTADSSAELERGLQWGCSGVSSLSAMSCHLFCFPFALPLPPEKMAEVLSSYQSLNLVIQSQPLPLLELPLWLLRRLCLSSPQWAISSFLIAARTSGFLPPSAEARQMLNLLNQPRSMAEQPVCRGIPHKGQADLARGTRNQENRSAAMVPGSVDKARAVGEAVRVQAQVPKHQAGRWREQGDRWKVKTDLQIPRAEHLQHSTESYSGSVEELLDSLELHEDFIDLKYLAAQRNSTMSWLVDSLEQPGNDRNCVRGDGGSLTISVVKGQSPEPKIRTVSSLLSDLLQIESLCGCTMQLLALLFQTIPDGSVLPVDPALLNLALGHHDDGVRATACELLTRLRPNLGHFPAGVETGPSLLRKLLSCLSDPAPSVRRSACRAAVKTLALIAHADLGPEVSEGNWCVQKGVMGGRRGTVGGPVRGSETRVVETEGEGLLEVVMGAASTALSLLSDSDAVIRRHSCVVLGTMAVIDGCGLALISAGAPRQLQHVARGDSHHAVRRQAESALHAFSQQDTLQQALKSMDAELKLHHGSPSSSLPSNYKALVRQQDRPNRGKHNVDSTPGSNV